MLLDHPAIAHATVVGRPNHVTGMVVVATVKTVGPVDRSTFSRDVRRHCRSRLEPYKVPVVVDVSDVDHHNARFKKGRAFT